jgi:hypothetical protein
MLLLRSKYLYEANATWTDQIGVTHCELWIYLEIIGTRMGSFELNMNFLGIKQVIGINFVL